MQKSSKKEAFAQEPMQSVYFFVRMSPGGAAFWSFCRLTQGEGNATMTYV
jgi:hypothetical protein